MIDVDMKNNQMNRIKEVLNEKGIKQTWLAEKLGKSKWLLTNGEHLQIEIRQINYLQTIKRSRELIQDELLILDDIAKSIQDEMILTSVYALLDNREKTALHYKQIKPKKDFIEFPICKFVKPLLKNDRL